MRLSQRASFSPSCNTQSSRCPPPGARITAVPVALSLGGRKTVRYGLCTLMTLYSPLFWTSCFSFSSFRASNPGAPFSQRGTTCGSSRERIASLRKAKQRVRSCGRTRMAPGKPRNTRTTRKKDNSGYVFSDSLASLLRLAHSQPRSRGFPRPRLRPAVDGGWRGRTRGEPCQPRSRGFSPLGFSLRARWLKPSCGKPRERGSPPGVSPATRHQCRA